MFIIPSAIGALVVSLFHTGVSGAQPVHDSKKQNEGRQLGRVEQKKKARGSGVQGQQAAVNTLQH